MKYILNTKNTNWKLRDYLGELYWRFWSSKVRFLLRS